MTKERKNKILGFFDNLEGDKVIWIIFFMLTLISIVCIFSSSSRLAKGELTRVDIVVDQLKTVGLGLIVLILTIQVRNIKLFKFISKLGFFLSLVILLFLLFGPKSGFIHSGEINNSRRIIVVGGKQIFVYEIVKILMVMYISWAVEAVKKGKLAIADMLASNEKLKWFGTPTAKKWMYINLPFIIITVCVMPGSNSAALFIAVLMALTILFGGGSLKELALMGFLGALVIGGGILIYKASDGEKFSRLGTMLSGSRSKSLSDMENDYHLALESGSAKEKQDALDRARQPYSAIIALKEGGFFGKGPGQSTQRLIVPDISEDYMFSFIIEEYGLLGALLIIFLYASLPARSTLIVKNCGNDEFTKTLVAGLTLMITLQAFLHMFVSARILPMTGQTLPLVSHGTSAYLCFSFVFGMLLSISRISQRRLEREEAQAEPLYDADSTTSESLNDLDAFESEI